MSDNLHGGGGFFKVVFISVFLTSALLQFKSNFMAVPND